MSKTTTKGVRIIRPYRKEPANMRTLEGTLYKEGLSFVPGTVRKFFPRVDSRGIIRTGLDENSIKIRTIEDETDRTQEFNRVQRLREYYESLLDESLEPSSTFYTEIKDTGYSLEDGDNIFNMENPREAVNFYWLLETEMIAPTVDHIESGKMDPNIVKFFVYNGEVDTKTTFERKKRINSSIAELATMSAIKRKKIQKLIGLGLSADAGEEEVYNAIDEYLRTPANVLGNDPIEMFNRVLSYSEDLLDVKSLVKDLIDQNIVRVKGSMVYEGEHMWAKSIEEFELLLADPKYTEEYEAFKDKLRNRLKINAL
jgi:hypothetical protein